MATVKPNAMLDNVRGRIGDLIFRQFRGQTVVSRAPDYSKRRRSAKQRAASRRFAAAVRHAGAVLADPNQRAAFARRASRTRFTLRGFIIRDYFKNGPQNRG